MKLLSIWINAIGNAWSMGEADWAYEEAPGGYLRSVAIRVWNEVFTATHDEKQANDAVVQLAKKHGIDPNRHRVHAMPRKANAAVGDPLGQIVCSKCGETWAGLCQCWMPCAGCGYITEAPSEKSAPRAPGWYTAAMANPAFKGTRFIGDEMDKKEPCAECGGGTT